MLIRTMLFAAGLWCAAAVAAESAPQGMAFDVYIRLEHGMTEGELVLRAGKPDHHAVDNLREGLKSYYYFPTTANPFLTTVSLRAGRIVNIERVRKSP
ncbi:MAG: hypothetical protein KIT13_03755 [Burkholderiales bacterium]|nr:hypothetical protein [Burkholderiales bacterium]MCW5605572.1 hypothetical protein [Burkholderiales bacterium]